ncbi:MAG: hypothetical protein AAFY52_08815 [Pseudomonadota bacterium]
MPSYLAYLLIVPIGYFSYACGRAYGWTGCFVYLGALMLLAIAVVINADAQAGRGGAVVLVTVALVLAAIIGATGVAKRRAALQSAGSRPPKSG